MFFKLKKINYFIKFLLFYFHFIFISFLFVFLLSPRVYLIFILFLPRFSFVYIYPVILSFWVRFYRGPVKIFYRLYFFHICFFLQIFLFIIPFLFICVNIFRFYFSVTNVSSAPGLLCFFMLFFIIFALNFYYNLFNLAEIFLFPPPLLILAGLAFPFFVLILLFVNNIRILTGV